jgi:hypothetical protein
MSYTIQKNINITDGYGFKAMYAFKEHLKNYGWLVPMSSDGYTVDGYNDILTSDQYDGYNEWNTSCWFVLKMPLIDSVQRQFMFQMGNLGRSWNIQYSYSAGFVGGAPKIAPTASDQKEIMTTSIVMFSGTETLFMAVGDVSDGYNCYMVGIDPNSSTKAVRSFFAVDRCVSGTYPSADIDPFVIWANRTGQSGTFGPSYLCNKQIAYESSLWGGGWFAKGQGNEVFARIQAFSYKTVDNKLLHANNQIGYGTNGINGRTDMLPVITGRASGEFSAPKGTKGTSSIINWYCTTSKTGDTYRYLSDRDKIVFDDVLLPWDGTIAVL